MNIYAGNLDYSLSESDLENAFSEFGTVSSVKIVKDHDTGKGKGFGFIEMPNDSEAKAAISNLNGAEIKGRKITVNQARPRRNQY